MDGGKKLSSSTIKTTISAISTIKTTIKTTIIYLSITTTTTAITKVSTLAQLINARVTIE